MDARWPLGGSILATLLAAHAASAAPVMIVNTGDPDGRMAMASRPAGAFAIEAADDFVLNQRTKVSSASFTGLLVGGAIADLTSVRVEIYRAFPNDSDSGRTSGPPIFGTPYVPTRVNSPSDAAFAERDSASGGLSFSVGTLQINFTAINSIAPGGIHPLPNQTTGGDGSLAGEEVRFEVTFATAIDLGADHYFFVPQVGMGQGNFFWLSAPKPIVEPGMQFAPDLQAWTRDSSIDPDWLRVGTDIVGGNPPPQYNAAFSLTGEEVPAVPEPGTLALFELGGFALLVARGRKTAR